MQLHTRDVHPISAIVCDDVYVGIEKATHRNPPVRSFTQTERDKKLCFGNTPRDRNAIIPHKSFYSNILHAKRPDGRNVPTVFGSR